MRISRLPPSWMSVPRPAMLVAMVTAPGTPAWLNDIGFLLVVAGVQNLEVLEAGILQHRCQKFGLFDRGGADQNRLLAVLGFLDLGDDRLEFFFRRSGRPRRPRPCA